jgi:phospholipase/lecithinase/hemolysin/uncharacterized protein YhjY with autotransporter beta-barrel domain
MGASLALSPQAEARAQSFSGFYMFGDSMSDPGNLNAFDPRQFGPPNWKGRPSNGPTWADYMPGLLNISYNQYFNFALSGATIGNSNDVTSLLGPYQLGRVGAIPSTALVGLNGGGNGISNAILDGSLTSRSGIDPLVQKFVGEMSTMVRRLHDKGGRTFIVMNQQDLGEASAIYSYNPTATALASYATRQYNAALTPAMTALSKSLGAKIIVVDVIGMNDVAKANQARYGITNWDRPCIDWFTSKPTGACGTTLNKDGTLDAPGAVKWDGVHMTTFGHQEVAAFTGAVLYSVYEGPRAFNYVQRLGLTLNDLANRQIDGRLEDLSEPSGSDDFQLTGALRGTSARHQGLSSFVQIGYQGANLARDDTNPSLGFDHRTQTGLIGLDYAVSDHGFVGGALGYLSSESKSDNGLAGANLTAYSATAYGVKRRGPLAFSGTIGGAIYQLEDVKRWTGSMREPITSGKTDGSGYFGGLRVGYTKAWGPAQMEAFGAVRVNQIKLGGYQETGAYNLSMIFGDRQANESVGTLGLVAQKRFSTSLGYIAPSLRVSIDRDLSQSAKTYRFGFVGGQNFDETYREPNRTVGRVGVGLKARLGRGLGLDLTADSAVSGSDGDDRRAAAQLSYRF